MNEHNNQIPESSYATGSTNPQKSLGGLVAVLLAVIIALGGLINLLSMMNVRLFHQMSEADPAIVFSRQTQQAQADLVGNKTPMLGIRCETVSPYLQSFYGLPKGVYVTQVLHGGAAQAAGLMAGDVIVSFAGSTVDQATELAGLVRSRRVGEAVRLTIVRGGQQYSVSLVLDAE